jgi:hypothetical protein
MTEQELINLEIERRALLETATEMGAQDRIMDTRIREMCNNLQAKAAYIQNIINLNTK